MVYRNTFLCINDKVYDAEYINQSLIVVRDFRKPLAEETYPFK